MFTGRTFLLTGATRGIGRQVAFNLARQNANLILIARSIEDLAQLQIDLQDDSGGHMMYFALDVSNELLVKRTFKIIYKKVSFLDGIINCAGAFGAIGKFEEVPPKLFLQSIEVNLMGAYHVCYHAFKLLKKAPRGKIINFAGGGVTGSFPHYSGYACGKIALTKLTENLAEEYPELDINIIAPGFIKSDLAKQTILAGKRAGGFYQKTLEMLADGGLDVGYTLELIQFLLSDLSNGISGKLISAPWDDWESESFQNKIRDDPNFCTVRRIDNKYFKSIASDK